MCFSTPSYSAPKPAPVVTPDPPKLEQPEASQDTAGSLQKTGNRANLRVDLTDFQSNAPAVGSRNGLQVA